MLKGVLDAFAYHFWSKYLPRHSRTPTKNTALKAPQAQHLPSVHETWDACERFVTLGCIALGLLQLVAVDILPGMNAGASTSAAPSPIEGSGTA